MSELDIFQHVTTFEPKLSFILMRLSHNYFNRFAIKSFEICFDYLKNYSEEYSDYMFSTILHFTVDYFADININFKHFFRFEKLKKITTGGENPRTPIREYYFKNIELYDFYIYFLRKNTVEMFGDLEIEFQNLYRKTKIFSMDILDNIIPEILPYMRNMKYIQQYLITSIPQSIVQKHTLLVMSNITTNIFCRQDFIYNFNGENGLNYPKLDYIYDSIMFLSHESFSYIINNRLFSFVTLAHPYADILNEYIHHDDNLKCKSMFGFYKLLIKSLNYYINIYKENRHSGGMDISREISISRENYNNPNIYTFYTRNCDITYNKRTKVLQYSYSSSIEKLIDFYKENQQ